MERTPTLDRRHEPRGRPVRARHRHCVDGVAKIQSPDSAAPLPLSLAGLGALAVNLFCAFRLARFRTHGGSLIRAAFLSSRNDALANIAIIAAGLVTAATVSAWPDLVVGLGIFVLNLDASRQVYGAARDEHRAALAAP
jgi:Co/Zn/Cd efflux system component